MANTDWSKFTPEEKQTDWSQFKPEGPEAEQDGPLTRGFKRAINSGRTAYNLAAGDAETGAALAAERADYARKNPGSPEGNELMAAWERGDGVTGGIKEVAGEVAKDWADAPNVMSAVRATGKNLGAMGGGILEQMPNMVAPMAGMLAGGAAGSLAGPAGTVGGAFAGATAGNTAMESAEQVDRAIRQAGINPEDKEAVKAYLAANGDTVLGQAATKGAIIGAVDTATMGAGHLLLSAPGKAAAGRALEGMGVDLANRAAVKAAMASDDFAARVASDAAYQASQKGLPSLARNATVAALEPAGEFTGEYLGQGAATGDWDTKGAALEALSSVGQGAVTFAGQKLYEAATNPLRGKEAPPVQRPGDVDQANADLGFAAGQYSDLVPSEQRLLGSQPSVIAVPTQDGGTTTIDRNTGPLSDIAVDVVQGQIQTGMPLRAYATAMDAQAALDQRPDGERMRVAPHPRASGRYAVVPKTAEALTAIDRKAEAQMKSEERLATVESEDGNASQVATTGGQGSGTVAGGSAGDSPSVGGVTGGRGGAAGASAPGRGTDTSLGDASVGDAALDELAPAPVQPISSMPAAERVKAERQAAARAEAQARGAQLTDDEVASANTEPTEAQQAAGNYQKGHVKIGGLDISIENPAGSTRSGKEGKKSWSVKMSDHYGYIKRTEGADGEQVDVYVKAGTATDHNGPVFVIDQYDPKTGQFDEHKAFVGYRTALDVTRAYDAHFSDGTGPKRRKGITKMAPDAFTAWARHGDTSQAADKAQAEIAQSTGKESKKRSNGDLYQAAADANKRKQERRLPTEQNDTLAVREATGAEVSVVSEKDLPEADAAPAGHVSRQTAEFARHVAKLFGKRVVFVEGMPADGFYNHGNTIYLSTTGSVHHLRLLGHEMLHALRSQSKETYAKLLESVRDVVTDAQLKSQFRDYFSQDKGKKDWTDDQITEWLADDKNRDFLTEEWMADLSGNRWTEAGFWEDVFTQIENKYGSEQAKGIIAKLRLALVTALNKLKTLVRGSAFAVDGRVTEHLDQIRAALATGFADYAKAVKDKQTTEGTGDVKFARRQAAPKLTKKEFKEIAEREATRIFEGKTVEQSNPLDDEQWQEVRRIALQKLKPMQRAAALKAEREYLELQKEADILSEKYKERAAQVMAKVKENGSSSVSIVDGSKPATVEGTGKMVRGKPKVLTIDIGRFFLGRQKKIDISTEEGRKAAGAAMAREAAYALTQDGHAVGWYDRKVREALAISALVHPELLNSKKAQVVFKMIAAITSNGQAVRDNFILANIAYSNFKNGVPLESVLGEGGGARRGAMIKSLIKLRNMIEDHGAERVGEIMLMPLTVKEIQNQFGLKVSGEHMTTVLPAAVGLGGPKIGSFYANLSGHFDSLTMDMWFMRTAGRITGNIVVMPKTVGINLNELASILPESGEWNGVDVKTLRAEIDSYNKLDEDEQADVETVLETVPETIMYARAQLQKFSAPDAEGKTFTQKTLQNENARRLVSALDSTNDSPGNGAERNNLRGVVDVARGLLARHGIDLNVADIQAVLWYYEKNLFTKLGANNASAKPWDYASAARFGVGRTLGLVDVKSSKRAGQVGAGEQPVAGGVSAEGQRLGEDAGQVKASPSRILFEVAPDPNDARLTSAWNSLASADKLDISKSVATRLIPKILSHFNATGQMSEQIGGYQGESNPSFTILLDSGDPDAIAKASGFVLSQDMMIAVSDKAFPGGVKTGAVTIEIGNADPAAVYTAIYDKVKAAEGHTTVNGQMIILNNPKFGISTEELGRQVDEALGGRYNAFGDDGIYAEFPESEDYGYAIQDAQGTAAGSPDSQWARVLRAEANQQLESELRQRGVKLSTQRSDAPGNGRDGSSDARTSEEVRGYGTAAPGAVTVQGTHYSQQERANLDGRYYGTGMRGAEGPRVQAAADPRLKERVYFYVDKGTGVRPEDGVGSIAHTAQLNNVYDANADTWLQQKVGRELAGDAWLNAFESSVIDNGFDGYVTDFGTQRAAVLLGRHNVPVTRGKGGVSEAKQAAITAKRTDLPMGKMTGAEWKKLEPRATELEDDKSYYRDQVRFSPSRFDAIAEAFADRSRRALANPRNTRPVLIHSDTPASMQILGWANRPLMVEASELAKIANKPGFETDEKIGNLVLDLARPGAMFWNDKQGSLNILRREDMRGAPALIAVRPGVPMGIDRAHLMVTAHRLENQGALLRKITSGELKPLYLDQANPLIKQAMQTRKYRASTLDLLAPENLHARASVQLDTSSRLLSEADLVKWEQDNWGDAPKFSPARLTEDRIDRLMSQYAYTMDDKKSKAYIAWVRPESYLAATTIPGRERAQLESEKRPLDKDGLRNEYQEIFLLGKFDPENGWWKTTGHEGRHRMMALRDAGITRVPVVFGAHEGERREPIGNLFVTPQRWGNAKAERGFFAANLIPINYENLGKIKTEFGGDAAVKFSPSRAQTETPEFKKWYEGSNLRNADGSPMVLYHGTNKDFSRFGISKTGAMGPGVYLGDDPEVANAYSDGTGANVMPVYARGRYIGNREWSSYVSDYGWKKGREKAIEDGVAGVWDQKFESAVLVFDPANIKSAIGNNGKFDPTNPDIRYSPSRWYFSPLQRAFEQAPDRVFSTAPQVKAWLSSNAGKLGVKQDEIQWSGINDWLDLQGKQKVGKSDIENYLRQNGVQVTEVEKGKAGYDENNPQLPDGWSINESEDNRFHYQVEDAQGEVKGYGNSDEDAIADAYSGHPEAWGGAEATQYSQYVLPGGENYRELLLTLPKKAPTIKADGDKHVVMLPDGRRFGAYSTYADAVSALDRTDDHIGPNYKSSHWSEKNILSHIRFNDRTDADGNRVLFIEELQSDWGQKGKKAGFEPKLRDGWRIQSYENETPVTHHVYGPGMTSPYGVAKTVEEAKKIAGRYGGLTSNIAPKAPFVTDTKAWVSLAVKRMIAYAVENGYDKVAFVNGEQSADRYDLSKRISSLEITRLKEGEQYHVYAKSSNGAKAIDRAFGREELPDVIGKDLADRAISDTSGAKDYAEYKGLDLRIGGEGMKIFYDKIVPQTVSDVLKKVGGGKLESIEIEGEYTADQKKQINRAYGTGTLEDVKRAKQMKKPWLEQTGFSITPAMREQVGRGLPLFSLARAQIDVDGVLRSTRNSAGKPIAQTEEGLRNFWRWFGDSKVVDANGKPLVVYHGTTSGFSEFSKKGVKPNFSTPQKHIGFFFTDDQSYADRYTSRWGEPKDGANTMLVYLSLKNPKIEPIEKIDEIEDRMKQSDAKAYRADLEAQGYDGLVFEGDTKIGFVREYVAFRPNQIKSAIGNNGQFDPTNPDIRMSLARKVSDAVNSTLGKLDAAVDGLSNLPDQFDYLRDRYLALGKIARVDEISTEVRKAFDGAAPADKQAVYDYLTTRGATTGRISDHKLRSIAKRIKDTINYTGDQLVARGLLDQEARDHYRDQYLPRMYLRHMLDDQAFKVIGMGKKPSDMGYLKHRKDIPQEIRDVVLGEIKDPSFLSVNAIGRAMRDVSLLDWMGKIAQNNDWVFPEIFVPWQGKKVTAYWLRAEADRIENQIPHYTPQNKAKAEALVAQMRSTAHQTLGSMSAIDHKKFKQIPDTRRYGLLRGMWVRNEIYNDIMGASQIVNADPTWFEDWFGFGGKGTRLTQWWKFTKVAANPPGQIRNFISNMVMLQLSGIGLHRLPFALIEAARDITSNGKYWQVAKKYGVTESTFTAQELFRVKRDLVEMEAQKGKLSSLRWLMSAGARFMEGVSDLYQFSEALGKTIKIMEEMKAGKSEAEAAIEAQKWLFDYSLVPQSVRIARNAPVGMPFLTYQIKVLPRLLEVAAKHPWRFLPWAGLLYGMQAAVASMFGVDDDELKKLKKSLPEWLQDRGHTVFLPFHDADGRLQVADVGYFFPWTFYSQIGKHASEGKIKKALVDDIGGQFSAPIVGAGAALMSNYDTFTKQPIYKETDPVGYQAAAIANYAYDLMAPPFISSHGVVSPMGLVDTKFGGKLTQALAGTTNRFGDPKATEEQALGAMLGFNFYGMDPEHTRVTNLKVMEYKIHEAEKSLKQRLMDKGLTQEQRTTAVRDYRERMNELQQEMVEYAKESQVPEQLKVKKR